MVNLSPSANNMIVPLRELEQPIMPDDGVKPRHIVKQPEEAILCLAFFFKGHCVKHRNYGIMKLTHITTTIVKEQLEKSPRMVIHVLHFPLECAFYMPPLSYIVVLLQRRKVYLPTCTRSRRQNGMSYVRWWWWMLYALVAHPVHVAYLYYRMGLYFKQRECRTYSFFNNHQETTMDGSG